MSRRLERTTSRTPEWAFIVLFVCAHALVAPLVVDLYPLSTMPMFSDRTRAITEVEVFAPDGQPLRAASFGLGSSYLANPSPRYGISPPVSAARQGQLLSADEVSEAVLRAVRTRGVDLAFVDVVQRVVGPLDTGAHGRVGVVLSSRVRVVFGP